MSDESKEQTPPAEAPAAEAPIMIDMPGLMGIKPPEPAPRLPVYKVETFTDMKSKEVLQFTQASLKGSIVAPPFQFFRGRTFVMVRQHPQAQPEQRAIVFDFPMDKSLEECFDNFDTRRDEHLEKLNRDAQEQQRIIAAKGMPQMRPTGRMPR